MNTQKNVFSEYVDDDDEEEEDASDDEETESKHL